VYTLSPTKRQKTQEVPTEEQSQHRSSQGKKLGQACNQKKKKKKRKAVINIT